LIKFGGFGRFFTSQYPFRTHILSVAGASVFGTKKIIEETAGRDAGTNHGKHQEA
jgi:hypothetical protein